MPHSKFSIHYWRNKRKRSWNIILKDINFLDLLAHLKEDAEILKKKSLQDILRRFRNVDSYWELTNSKRRRKSAVGNLTISARSTGITDAREAGYPYARPGVPRQMFPGCRLSPFLIYRIFGSKKHLNFLAKSKLLISCADQLPRCAIAAQRYR
jgi:hypothetical protein